MSRSFFQSQVPLAPANNPLGMAGLEFVEFATLRPAMLGQVLEQLGFKAIARHVSKAVTLYRQGGIHFLVNAEPESFAARYAEEYGMGVCAVGIRVDDAARAYDQALTRGAWPFEAEPLGPTELRIPGVQGIGDSHVYFVDRWRGRGGLRGGVGDISIFDIDFRPIDADTAQADLTHGGVGLTHVDHLTQTVGAGRLQEWLDFYRDLFGFREIHEIDPAWQVARDARVMVSPCGELVIPLYEEGAQRTAKLHAYLPDHPGEGVQHIALATDDIIACVDRLRARGASFIVPPDRYYDRLAQRLAGDGVDIDALRSRGILADGDRDETGRLRLLFQIFVQREPGEIFFEIVQRSGHHGFGEGNLDTLVDAPR